MLTKEFSLEFPVCAEGILFDYRKNGRSVFRSELKDGVLTLSVSYTYRPEPLVLCADVQRGDRVRFECCPCRIALKVRDLLKDEEWPCGELLLADAEPAGINTQLCWGELPPEKEQPSVIGSITRPEGRCPGNGVFVGDCIPYESDGRYHLLWLKDRHHHGSKWGKGAHQWEHMSTKDLIRWEIHPTAVPITDPEEGSICTGSWIFLNGRHYLYYTVRTMDGSPAPLRRSVSENGYHFCKDPDFSFTLSDRYTGATARDPKVFRLEDGLHMLVTTTDRTTGCGCLVHLFSEDGERFSELGELWEGNCADEPECPDWFTLNGRYYLIFSLRGVGQYRVSEAPLSGWRTPADPVIPCSSVPKCAVLEGRILFAGFDRIGSYGGTLVLREAWQKENGELAFDTAAAHPDAR